MTPGRQRSHAADEAIIAATLQVLRADGYQGLTMVAVIEAAGVSSATLYRRWPTKQALVVAALRTLVAEPSPVDTGSLTGDIESLVKRIARAMSAGDDLFAVLAAEVRHDEELRAMNRAAFIEPRLEQMAEILARAGGRGELAGRADADTVLSLVTGPLYHRAYILGDKLTAPFLRAVVRHVVVGLTEAR